MSWSQLFAKKPIDDLLQEAGASHELRRVLGPVGLTTLGVGAIIGAGIFVLTGNAAAQHAGPAILLSFVISGIGCAFAGLCYAEMAAMIPIAGSAYTYSYATMGQFLAWIIGWDLILEYSFGASTVAVGWSGYVVSFLHGVGIHIPAELTEAPGTLLIQVPRDLLEVSAGWHPSSEGLKKLLAANGIDPTMLSETTGILNVPAIFIVLLITGLLVFGIQESARVNSAIVILKVSVLIIFIVVGLGFLLQHTQRWSDNWKEFLPPNNGTFGEYGWSGVLRGAGKIFFAYIGFDAVSTAAQEAKNPQRDMPIGILGSLVICTVLYILYAVVLTGVVAYQQLSGPAPIAVGIDAMHMDWLAPWVKLGAIAGLSSVILVMLLGQPRVFWIMSRDGLLPPLFARIHPRFKTPYITTLITGAAVAVVAGLFPIHLLGELVSIGTLLAFVLVCGGVLVLRYTNPDIPRPFKTPWVHFTCIMGILVCLLQMVFLPGDTWLRLIIWMALGLVIYFAYGMRHSKLKASTQS